MRADRMMNIAKNLASKGEHKQHKLGCVLAQGNRVVGLGFNKNKTNPKSTHPYKATHAELVATLNAPEDSIVGSTAYVYRQHKNGKPALARPCKHCYQAMKDAGIGTVVYSTPEGNKTEYIN